MPDTIGPICKGTNGLLRRKLVPVGILLSALFKKWLYNEPGEADRGVSLSMGAVYRWADAICPVIKLNVNQWGVGICYDVNISKLSAASQLRGGFEFTLLYRITGNARNCMRTGCMFD